MVIEIEKKQYKVKTEWSEITLELAEKVNEIPKPKSLLAVYNAKTKEDFEIASKKLNRKKNIAFFRKVIAVLGNAPIELLERTDNGIVDFYFGYLEKIVLDLHNMYPFSYDFQKLEYFKFKGIKFYMPRTAQIINDEKPLSDESVGAFVEAMNARSYLAKTNDLAGINAITSIFARPKDVAYTEIGSIERASMFLKLPMAYHWEVFFCLMISLSESQKIINTFSQEAKAKVPLN
jgi:hypothetical protein